MVFEYKKDIDNSLTVKCPNNIEWGYGVGIINVGSLMCNCCEYFIREINNKIECEHQELINRAV